MVYLLMVDDYNAVITIGFWTTGWLRDLVYADWVCNLDQSSIVFKAAKMKQISGLI